MLKKRAYLILLFCLLLFVTVAAEEGMFPLNQLHLLDLTAKGLEIDPQTIFNEQTISLSDAIVNIGGCTGSFVSADGLILTNHHCAFRAVREASTVENDYLRDGFLALNRSEEKEAKGYTVRITETYEDVSQEILSALDEASDLAERHKIIDRKRKEIVARAEADNPGKRAEVSEMFPGESYLLFLYTYIKDVRMVYVPPRSIGEFGGEFDNWEWPRHTGDFAFMRAYVAPDGSPADYSEENIPFQPKKHLKIEPRGVNEGDFVFILGYPARTYRHQTSYYMAFEQELRMPLVVDWYQWQIALMENISREDPGKALKFSSRIKGLANTEKNFRGKLQGMRRLNLVENKRSEETRIQEFIKKDQKLHRAYGDVLESIAGLFEERRNAFQKESWLGYLLSSVNLFTLANTIYKAAIEREKDDLERESAYMERNFAMTKNRLLMGLNNYDQELDQYILHEIINRVNQLPEDQRPESFQRLFGPAQDKDGLELIITRAYASSNLHDPKIVERALEMSISEIEALNDPFIQWVAELQPEIEQMNELRDQRNGALNKYSAQWAEVKKQYFKKQFIPDANRTFRLTYGYIEGYSPADAIYKKPITTLRGVLEKTGPEPPFDTPQKITDLYHQKDFGSFRCEQMDDVPVAILYSTDTSGGNSGSPVLNARGDIVGLNFDRTFEATINDFAWSHQYSRSIGVDIRYVLWVTQKFAGADYLLQEMGVTEK